MNCRDIHVRYWMENGEWCCAIPRDDFATQHGFHWKKYGIIGRGKTERDAWIAWERQKIADEVSIY